MTKMKKPISILLSILMMLSVFSGMTLTVGAAEKTIAEGVIYKLGDTIVLPGDGIYYVKDSERHPAQRIYSNGTITQFEGDEYYYRLEINEWGIYAYMETFDYWEELNNQGQSVLGITFTGSGTESDPYLPKLAIGVVESTWAGEGEGTEASPWLIKDLNDLRTLSANVADGMNYSGKYLKLTADIDCGSDNWEPIGGANAKMFMGTFDGDGKTITYSVISSENDNPKGLFANIGSAGTVKNLNVDGSIVNTAEYAGPAGGIAAYNSGLIENCYSAVDITKGCDRGTGGIAAHNEEGATIRYCAASGTLTWTGASDFYAYIGGITGENFNYNNNESVTKYVTNCAMLGDVLAENSDGDNYVGRLIGRQYDASTSDDCYYLDTMTVTGVVNSDSAEAKTKDELKEIGQAAYDAGYIVYGLALGAVASNPNQEAADVVIDLIDDIGTVENTPESKAKVEAAKAAYDALTDEQKALVTNVEILTAAEETVAAFPAEPVQYTVTVPSDCTVSQTLPAGSDYYLATVQAPLKKGSTYFTYWVDAEGRIVGTYRTYTFYVGSDMAVTPVYSTEADYAAERAKAVYAARALNVISKGEGAYAILAEHSVSTTDSLNSHGVLVTTDASLANADAMNCENQNENVHNFTASTTQTTKTGMIQINAQLTGDTVYVRPYIVDGSGEYHYFDIQNYALSASGDSAEEVVMLDSTDLDLTAENADGDAAAEAPADEAASIISTILEVVMNLIQRIVNYIKLALSIVK